jgi:putative transposase
LPKIGRVRSRWTTDLRVGKHAGRENRITGARLVKDVGWHIAFRVQSLEPQPESH